MFLNAATATLAPDLDLIAEVVNVHTHFTLTHGERIAQDLGEAAISQPIDLDSVKASFLVSPDTERVTFSELQERRRTIIKRMGNTDIKHRS